MLKASLLAATFVLATAVPTTFAADQVATKGTLVLGFSQNLAEGTICLNGQPICHRLRKLEAEEDPAMRSLEQGGSGAFLAPANETTGTPEMVCFGPYPHRCYGYFERRLQDVFEEHRRLEVMGDSQLKDIECLDQHWGLQCN